MIPIIDAHLDLAWCALSFNRDLTLPLDELNAKESHMTDERARGNATVSLPEMRKAGVGLCAATLLARSGPEQKPREVYRRTDLDYATPQIACAMAEGQLAVYRLLEDAGHIRLIRTARELDDHWVKWQSWEGEADSELPIGVILSMEGADPLIKPRSLDGWFQKGLRAIGPAHYGRGRYAYGTAVSGGLGEAGRELVKEMDRLGIALDVTHLCDESMAEALGIYGGPVLASHHNCRALVDGDRQLSDAQIKRLIDRDAVIGVVFDAWMMYPGYKRGETPRDEVKLEAAVDHIDHIAQLAGSTRHNAIGSDLDGGFGREQTPQGLDTIADLQKLAEMLSDRGFSDADIAAIFHGNWLRFFRKALSDG